MLNTRVAGAAPDAVILNDGSSVATYTLVWTAGNQPHPLLKTLPCERLSRKSIDSQPHSNKVSLTPYLSKFFPISGVNLKTHVSST